MEVKTIEEMYAAKEAAAAKAQAAKEAKWDTSAAGSEWEADEAEQMKEPKGSPGLAYRTVQCATGQCPVYQGDQLRTCHLRVSGNATPL